MHCPQCHADNPDQATACLACGTSLLLTCPQCNTELPPQANFCFHCGSAVTVPAAEPDEETLALLQREEFLQRRCTASTWRWSSPG